MNLIETISTLGTNVWIYGGSFLLVLTILVFIHEWGHYIVARLCGVRVETFSIGFGKELFGFTDKTGTHWKFSLIPLGGYVKLFGDIDPASAGHSEEIEDEKSGEVRELTEEEKKVAFYAKPVSQRALIVFAGPAINYIFAIILLSGLFVFNGKPVTQPSAAAVVVGSAAEKAGFLPHDTVVSINGETINNFEDIRRKVVVGLDQAAHFVIERDGELIDMYASPEKVTQTDRLGFSQSRGMLGVYSPVQAVDIKSIKSIDGIEFSDVEDIRGELMTRMGTTFQIEIGYIDEDQPIIIHPMAEYNPDIADPDAEAYNFLVLADRKANTFVKFAPLEAVVRATQETWIITTSTLEALGQIITGTRSAKELGGVVRIGAIAGDMAQQGIIALILFTALLSVNLGLINLFPVPLLDGGHLVFYAVEAALGKPIPEQMQEYAFRFGLVFLVGVMVYTNLNDIVQLTTSFF